MHLPDGTVLRRRVMSHPFGGLLETFEDVTDRLMLERSYNTLIAVQRETLDNLYEGIAVFGSDGRLKLSNPAFGRIWNLEPDILAADPHIADLVERARALFEDRGEWEALRERIIAQTIDRVPRHGRIERTDGATIDYAGMPLPDGAQLFSYVDVTDTIKVERALRERNEALETADRMKSEFIAGVSYELRTPLNVIIGFTEILNNQYFGSLNERQGEYAEGILHSSQQLMSLINDILDLATIEAGHLALERNSCDLFIMSKSVVGLVHERARGRDLHVELDCQAGIGDVVIDERRIKQVLFNLLSNAIKFTPAGGRVTLSVRRDANEVILAVSDTGIGIPVEDQGRVFEKFERATTATGDGHSAGVGLGLSLVRSIVELHQGRVALESAPKNGTTVSCYLPVDISSEERIVAEA